MKKLLLLIFSLAFISQLNAKNQIPIPDTLSGTTIDLRMHKDSVQFFPGIKTNTLAFNQYSYLGPTIILQKGQQVSINMDNQIGDTTAVHWHGMHVSSKNDGGPHTMIMDGMMWNPQFTVLDKAALYWYHPHFHGKTAHQAIKGAAGMIIVRDEEEAKLNLPRTYGVDDFPIAVQSMQFDSLNQPMPFGMQDSILLVNSARANAGESAYLNVPAQVIRLRLLNAAGERTFNFGFSNNLPFYIIGSDGGLLPNSISTTRIRMSPGERYEILLNLSGKEASKIYLMSYASELPMGVQGGPTMPMPPGNPPMDSPLNGVDFNILELDVQATNSNPITSIPTKLVELSRIPESQSNIKRSIEMSAESMMSMDGPFYLNGKLYDMERIDYRIPLDNTEIWEVTNKTMVAHPFHMHNIQFNILDRDGNKVADYEAGRKDVVMILSNETIRFIAKFDNFVDTIVPYVYHCHILMHEDAGMMGQYLVVPNQASIISDENFEELGIKIFPNPVSDYIKLSLPNQSQVSEIKIVNMSGDLVYSNQELSDNLQNDMINIEGISSGIYQIIVKQNNKFLTAKFVK
jgi:blue copper oxidase